MEAAEFLNSTDPVPYRSLASLDRTHKLTAFGTITGQDMARNWTFSLKLWF